MTVISYVACLLSPLLVAYTVIKKKEINPIIHVLYLSLALSIIYWIASAPAYRFIAGSIAAMLFVLFTYICSINNKLTKEHPFVGKCILVLFVLFIFILPLKGIWNYHYSPKTYVPSRSLLSIWYMPFGAKVQHGIDERSYSTYKVGPHTVYTPNKRLSYDALPATPILEPEDFSSFTKLYPLEAIESRGPSLQDGFRPVERAEQGWWKKKKKWWKSPLFEN